MDRAARSIRKGQKRGELPAHIDPGLAGAAMFGAMRQVMTEQASLKLVFVRLVALTTETLRQHIHLS